MEERDGGAAIAQRVPEDRVRAADSDRERVAQRLHRAQAEGRLDLYEFDERVRQVWAARTYGDLEQITADLPADRSAVPRSAAGPVAERDGGRGAVAAWITASGFNLLIWAVISLAIGSMVYPWWIWVAGPWGAVLLARWVTERGHPRRAIG